jgi:hypothetical protein
MGEPGAYGIRQVLLLTRLRGDRALQDIAHLGLHGPSVPGRTRAEPGFDRVVQSAYCDARHE